MDNVFVERLWRGVKHEDIYLRPYETTGSAQIWVGAVGLRNKEK